MSNYRSPGHGKLGDYLPQLIVWVGAEPDIFMPKLAAKLEASTGVVAHPASLSRALLTAGFSTKTLLVSECARTDVERLRCDGPTAPWLINKPMNRMLFETYLETQLAPTLRPGDVVISDLSLMEHRLPLCLRRTVIIHDCSP